MILRLWLEVCAFLPDHEAFLLIMIFRMGSAKSEGTKPKHQTLQLVERSEQKRLLQLYILSSHLAADAAGRAQQKALTKLVLAVCLHFTDLYGGTGLNWSREW